MTKKTVALVVGTRPEVIKMAPVWFVSVGGAALNSFLIPTGWHRGIPAQPLLR